MWNVLGVISVILLVTYFRRGQNSVWGGLSLGAITGFTIVVILGFMGKGFNWRIILKAIIIGIMAGFVADLLGKVPNMFKRRDN